MVLLSQKERDRIQTLAADCWDRDWDFYPEKFDTLIDYVESLMYEFMD